MEEVVRSLLGFTIKSSEQERERVRKGARDFLTMKMVYGSLAHAAAMAGGGVSCVVVFLSRFFPNFLLAKERTKSQISKFIRFGIEFLISCQIIIMIISSIVY